MCHHQSLIRHFSSAKFDPVIDLGAKVARFAQNCRKHTSYLWNMKNKVSRSSGERLRNACPRSTVNLSGSATPYFRTLQFGMTINLRLGLAFKKLCFWMIDDMAFNSSFDDAPKSPPDDFFMKHSSEMGLRGYERGS